MIQQRNSTNQLPWLTHVVQLKVNEIVKHLSVEAHDDVAAMAFNEDNIQPALSEYSVLFGKTLHKVS